MDVIITIYKVIIIARRHTECNNSIFHLSHAISINTILVTLFVFCSKTNCKSHKTKLFEEKTVETETLSLNVSFFHKSKYNNAI